MFSAVRQSVFLAALATCVTAEGGGSIGKPCYANETSLELFQEVDLSGKVALVTGADKGIGLQIATTLAARGATVILGCRKQEEMTNTSALIKKAVPHAKLYVPSALLDLSSFQVVRDFAQSLQNFSAIDILVNNAAMANNPHQLVTKDGFEMAFQVDYPSQWLLTDLLLPQVRKAKGRIVNLVSKAYRMACVFSKRTQCMSLDRLPPPVINGSQKVPVVGIPVTNYGIARLLVIRWTEDLAQREAKAGTGVLVTSVNPGFVNTSMADQHNLSPLFRRLACETETRPGSGCPVSAGQGALTPAFLSLAPASDIKNGEFYEWCETAAISQCVDIDDGRWIPFACTGNDQKYKDGLWELTSKWVANFTGPFQTTSQAMVLPEATSLAVVLPDELDLSGPCPGWLGPICHAWGCATGCLTELNACIKDAECKKSLESSIACSAKMMAQHKSATDQLACFIPVNTLRDNVFYCLLDEHRCIHPPKDTTKYPICEDKTLLGDATYNPSHLLGDWWKVRGWNSGEIYECRPCGRVSFTPYRTLPWPVKTPPDTSNFAVISSSWYDKDAQNKTWVVNETSLFGPRDGHEGYPAKQTHRGVMYGVSYLENFTIVHDGSQEKEPFLVLYGCGSTIQGSYVTGFVMAKTPVASPALASRIDKVIAKYDFLMPTSTWCEVDNHCNLEEDTVDSQGYTLVV